MSTPDEHYLVGLDLAGRRVVVVGGGQVAQRRVVRLIAAGAVVEVVSPEVTPAVEGMASAAELAAPVGAHVSLLVAKTTGERCTAAVAAIARPEAAGRAAGPPRRSAAADAAALHRG